MKRKPTILKDLTRTASEIAILRGKRARIDDEIACLQIQQREKIVLAITDAVGPPQDIDRLPVEDIAALIAGLGANVTTDNLSSTNTASTADEEEGTIEAFVRLSRNASASNRKVLEAAGLHWNGRDGGWTGSVTKDGLGRLRDVFGERVKKPVLSDGGELPASAHSAQRSLPDDEAGPTLAASLEKPVHTDLPESAERTDSPATTALRTFRGLPTRRPVA